MTQMRQIAEVAIRCWLDSWPGTMQQEDGDHTDMAEAYEIMTRMCEEDDGGDINL